MSLKELAYSAQKAEIWVDSLQDFRKYSSFSNGCDTCSLPFARYFTKSKESIEEEGHM